jgi:glucose-1-phosphate cytidylyltransferase
MTSETATPPVMILCGGKGTRLRERTEAIPKALVEIGGKPIVWHVMKIYASVGFRRFVLCLGYKGELIREYFSAAPGARPAGPDSIAYDAEGETWTVLFADTGLETNTGGRIKRAATRVSDARLLVTYGDGVASVDVRELVAFHADRARLATVTCVRPRCPFGIVDVDDDDRILAFREKPQMTDWVNGGFFVFERRVLDYLGDDDVLEREPLERLAKEGQLSAYRFDGFWMCMDTYKDMQQLNELWASGERPWKLW